MVLKSHPLAAEGKGFSIYGIRKSPLLRPSTVAIEGKCVWTPSVLVDSNECSMAGLGIVTKAIDNASELH